ncbi:MAG: flagellar protein FliS [Planctomycetaceae bacterium]|nr:flagellar protein FliS [Planctomycetaceae bacterium]MCA9044810.1 flagellar protein FliS [Planctomycetaceae bacterium]MCB9953239.1 flagellar protein FliS [Planctomycetaceae bacterium]
MSGLSAYQQVSTRQLTRIDLLVALYDTTLRSLKRGATLLIQSADEEFQQERLKATRLLLGLLSGIDPEYDEIAKNTYRLVIFALDQISEHSPRHWESAHEVISQLREGFHAIRAEANRLQATGEIPDIQAESNISLSVG